MFVDSDIIIKKSLLINIVSFIQEKKLFDGIVNGQVKLSFKLGEVSHTFIYLFFSKTISI